MWSFWYIFPRFGTLYQKNLATLAPVFTQQRITMLALFSAFSLTRSRQPPGWPDVFVKKIAQKVAQPCFCYI
jgi:hypothetical protein